LLAALFAAAEAYVGAYKSAAIRGHWIGAIERLAMRYTEQARCQLNA
jgi:hypothetical protein